MNNTKVVWTGRVISGLVSLPFAFSAVSKLFYNILFPEMPEQMALIGLPLSILFPVAILEVLCVVIYLIPATSVLGAVLFTGFLGGAILTHLRVGQSVLMHVILGLLIWLGIYLREPRLHAVLPFRKKG